MNYHIVDKSNNVNSELQNELGIVKAKLEDSTNKVVEIIDENLKFKVQIISLIEKAKQT